MTSQSATNLRSVLDLKHNLVIQSELFSAAGQIQLAAGASYKIGFTSSRNIMFTRFKYRTASDRARLYFYEGIAYSGGTLLQGTARNRQIQKTPSTVMHGNVTATTNPVQAVSFAMFGLKACGEFDSDEPLILARNTPYIFEFMNDANSQEDFLSWFMTGCEVDVG